MATYKYLPKPPANAKGVVQPQLIQVVRTRKEIEEDNERERLRKLEEKKEKEKKKKKSKSNSEEDDKWVQLELDFRPSRPKRENGGYYIERDDGSIEKADKMTAKEWTEKIRKNKTFNVFNKTFFNFIGTF